MRLPAQRNMEVMNFVPPEIKTAIKRFSSLQTLDIKPIVKIVEETIIQGRNHRQ